MLVEGQNVGPYTTAMWKINKNDTVVVRFWTKKLIIVVLGVLIFSILMNKFGAEIK